MKNRSRLLLGYLLFFTTLFGHEVYRSMEGNNIKQESVQHSLESERIVKDLGGRPLTWTQWIGSFHFIFLHFPIALITTTVISELLFMCFRRPIFDFASRFMLLAAAVLAIPTALLGLIYSYTDSYSGFQTDFILWHMWAGILTAVFAIFVAFIRTRLGISKLYYASLFVLFLLVNITGYLGAGMIFGPYHMHPPL